MLDIVAGAFFISAVGQLAPAGAWGQADPKVIEFHLARGDFSRWFAGTIRDRRLATLAAALERDLLRHRTMDIERARERLVAHIKDSYEPE